GGGGGWRGGRRLGGGRGEGGGGREGGLGGGVRREGFPAEAVGGGGPAGLRHHGRAFQHRRRAPARPEPVQDRLHAVSELTGRSPHCEAKSQKARPALPL